MRMRDDDGHHAMMAVGKAWKRVKTSQTRMWSDWTMVIGPGLMKARAEAMSVAETNRPIGKGYNMAMAGLLEEYGVADMSETARAHILKIMENLAAVEEWRAKQEDPDDLNHPSRVWQKYQRSSTQADERTQKERERRKAERRESAAQELEAALERIRELEAEIESLRVYIHELEAAIANTREASQAQPKRRSPKAKSSGDDLFEPAEEPKPVKRKPGRPKGSKNRPKPAMEAAH